MKYQFVGLTAVLTSLYIANRVVAVQRCRCCFRYRGSRCSHRRRLARRISRGPCPGGKSRTLGKRIRSPGPRVRLYGHQRTRDAPKARN